MKQIPVDFNVFAEVNKGYKKSKLQIELEKFIDSNEICVEITDYNHCDAYCCSQAFRLAIKRFKMNNVACITYDKKPYLIRKDLAPEWFIKMLG